MNKVGFIKEVATRTEKTQKDIKAILDAMQDVTFDTLASGEEVKLMDSVTLAVVHKEARTARNPQTGESVEVAAKNAVRCKFGKAIKEAVNS